MPIAPLPGGQPDTRFSYPSAEPSHNTQMMARHAIKAQDPAFMPHMARRQVPQERGGAAYRTTVAVAPAIAPEAGATLQGGRLFPSSINRSSSAEFQIGETTGY